MQAWDDRSGTHGRQHGPPSDARRPPMRSVGSEFRNVEKLAGEGATGALTLDDLLKALQPPRAVWMMVPAAVVDGTLARAFRRAWKAATSSSTAAILITSTTSAAPTNCVPRVCTTSMWAPAAASGDWSAASAR